MTTRTITIATANLGRDVSVAEFMANLARLERVPGKDVFYGLQEIDEADKPEEWRATRRRFADTHRFIGAKTAVPILVPRSWRIHSRHVTFASAGVAHLSPNRHVVQGIVFPDGKPDCRAVPTNTHFARNDPRLEEARAASGDVLRDRIAWATGRRGLAAWLTADINKANYARLGDREERFVSAGLDLIRGFEPADHKPSMEQLDEGTIDLTIDGHNLHWAKVRLVWP